MPNQSKPKPVPTTRSRTWSGGELWRHHESPAIDATATTSLANSAHQRWAYIRHATTMRLIAVTLAPIP